ncbi:serine hydrolase [Rhizobium lentis]|uniref:Serine hydrolase n=2 Tax=Rhizobium lentis TaxID=1138194 RepID=A0ABS7I9D1_9HYPH|nr:serine hydrolase [Rhizobium lentis]MBX5051881.1 serine hydrolase [Rhizobium lentis]MBX5071439.1 serine hydrolase [Rhizobium lentis]MBX5088453.1 serine hydrolase [Rhizobium lentis]MBX5108523.1 serine hydrolase [Rhizobium lentis]
MHAALAASVSFSVPGFSQAASAPHLPIVRGDANLQSHGEYIDQMIADFAAEHGLPGISMAIVQAPYIPRSAGYGRTSLTNDELASSRTIWNVGPITQGFTAVAIMQLKEAGKLNLDDTAGKYVDGLPEAWSKVTIKQLMQHSSGIPDYRDKLDATKSYAPSELIDLVRSQPVLFERGTQVHISATNFTLLALVIERASGMSYHDFIWQNQIEKVGLRSTMFAADMKKDAKVDRPPQHPNDNQHSKFKSDAEFINPPEPATGYIDTKGQLTATSANDADNLYGFGNVWSSAEDISQWDIALAGSVLVKDAADRDVIYKPTTLANGIIVPAMAGWEFTHHPGFMEVKGNSPGFSSYLSRFTSADELVCVTLLTNKEGVDLTVLARQIAEAYKVGLGAEVDQHEVIAQESKFDAKETIARLKVNLERAKVPVFATVDHSANAAGVGEDLRPTTVITFGNPKVGTKLMQADQAIALDLPLRVLVWEDEIGRTWIGYQNPEPLKKRYAIKDTKTVDAMMTFVAGVVGRSANVYSY